MIRRSIVISALGATGPLPAACPHTIQYYDESKEACSQPYDTAPLPVPDVVDLRHFWLRGDPPDLTNCFDRTSLWLEINASIGRSLTWIDVLSRRKQAGDLRLLAEADALLTYKRACLAALEANGPC